MLKNIKNYAMALAAIVIASTSATMMSFKAEEKPTTNQEFGMKVENRGQPNETRTWVSLDGLVEGEDYECVDFTDICKGEFAPEQINPSTNLPYDGQLPQSTTEGHFTEKIL